MKRFLVFVIGLAVIIAGGVYFTAETYILPKQEKVWRTLLEDLPYGLTADFEEVDFKRAGLVLSVKGMTVSDSGGNTVKISEVVAENTVKTAFGNLVRFVIGQEEENYDVVRFIGVEPTRAVEGVDLKVKEIKLLNLKIGIDNKLPSTMKTLTGKVSLEEAFKAGKFKGFEILGATASAQGINAELDSLVVHDISWKNLGLVALSGLQVTQGAQTLAVLESFRTTNFNIAMMMEPRRAGELLKAAQIGDLSEFNIFHMADKLVLVGLDVQVQGFGGLGIDRMMYEEEETQVVELAGIVPTRTYSELRGFDLAFPGLAIFSPEAGLFMQTTGITELHAESESDSSWDLAVGIQKSNGWLDLIELMKFTLGIEVGNFRPKDFIKAISYSASAASPGAASADMVMDSMLKSYGDITLIDFGYLMENKSLIERLMRFAEAATGMPAADLKAAMDGQLAMVQADPNLPPSLVDDIDALRQFIADPQTLRITFQPPQPVSANELMAVKDPNVAVEMIGVTITANETL